MIVVASVLIGGGVTSDDGLVDETSVKGEITGGVDAITGGVDVHLMTWIRTFMNLWVERSEKSSSMCRRVGPAETHVIFQSLIQFCLLHVGSGSGQQSLNGAFSWIHRARMTFLEYHTMTRS
ncbi:hypothetical protein Tco_1318443 [Tanacetum coccineum]